MNLRQLSGQINKASEFALQFQYCPWIAQGGVIAGGCLRDTFLGRPVKDVDIFMPAFDGKVVFDGVELPTDIEETGKKYGTIDALHVVKATYAGHDVDLIWVWPTDDVAVYPERFPEFVIGRFDISLCQIGWSLKDELYCGPKFLTDARNKLLRVVRASAGHEAHLDRLQQKYQDFTVQHEASTTDDDGFYL